MCWIPSHIGVKGNERGLGSHIELRSDPTDKFRIPYTDLKPIINKFLHTKWQQQWRNNIHKKFFQIQLTLGEWRPAFRKSKREQVISWLCIGHTRLTHSFILKQEQQPQCLTCQTPCTIRHLRECTAFALIRNWCVKVNSLINLFENVLERQACTKKYDELKQMKSCLSKPLPTIIRLEILGWTFIDTNGIWH